MPFSNLTCKLLELHASFRTLRNLREGFNKKSGKFATQIQLPPPKSGKRQTYSRQGQALTWLTQITGCLKKLLLKFTGFELYFGNSYLGHVGGHFGIPQVLSFHLSPRNPEFCVWISKKIMFEESYHNMKMRPSHVVRSIFNTNEFVQEWNQ